MNNVKARCLALTIISISLVIVTYSGWARASREPTLEYSPTPTLTFLNSFPENLVCSDMETPGNLGPTWNGVTIGKSSVEDLLKQFGVENQDAVQRPSGALAFRLPISLGVYPVDVCVQGATITAMTITMTNVEPVFLIDFVSEYGIPDAVTYTSNPYSRVIFWFEQGLAVEVSANVGDLFFGRVGEVALFPYQPVTGYEARWPYNRTWPEWIPSDEFVTTLPDTQNPFDFDAMMVTITAQPSRTPTPTFTPRPSQTATLTPGPTSTPD